MPSPAHTEPAASRGIFATTRWSVVLHAADDQPDGAQALETLCRAYWYPLYAYLRRLGNSPEDAQDLVQSFFAYLLQKRLLAKADPEAGRFRSFLLGSLRKYLANEWRKATAQRRGGGATPVSLDAVTAEERYTLEPADPANPQVLFDRAWAVSVLDGALAKLEAEHATAGKQRLFEALHPLLQGERDARGYAAIGAELGLSEGAVKVAVHRLRQRYREVLRAAVAHTVADPSEVDTELQQLLVALSR